MAAIEVPEGFDTGNLKVTNDNTCEGGVPYGMLPLFMLLLREDSHLTAYSAAGQYYCANLLYTNGTVICLSCAIAAGDSPDGTTCVANNYCSPTNNTCQIETDGEPHCV